MIKHINDNMNSDISFINIRFVDTIQYTLYEINMS